MIRIRTTLAAAAIVTLTTLGVARADNLPVSRMARRYCPVG
jgi:hypothetical protein